MLQQATILTVLQSVEKHNGVWGWYQYERAYPPGSLPDMVRVTDVLNELESTGLIEQVPQHPQARYRLTPKGETLLAEQQ